jgi:catechol 2,3-dioxygenase-like lactoylglutathione lyase family enzyme
MSLPVQLDHCVIHVSEWERSNAFYRDVMGAELVQRPVGWAYRFGDRQLNVHGPGVAPAEVARLPVQPGNTISALSGAVRSLTRSRISGVTACPSSAVRWSGSAPRERGSASISAIPTGR